MSDFHKFATLVKQRFDQLSNHELFVTVNDKDSLWDSYLAAFPEGTNPMFRERTEHDCSTCRNFIKNLSSVVAIIDGNSNTIWQVEGAEYPYNEVAKKMHELVSSAAITGIFRTSESSYGAESNRELNEDGTVTTWRHFHGKIANKHFSPQVDKARGDYATTVGVFRRGLTELSANAFTDVLDLINSKALYRGEEFKKSIADFQKIQQQYFNSADKEQFIWLNATNPISRFRNTAIGTLIQDLSAGVAMEEAVRSFESKVAPINYKRPTALITPRMVENAMKTIKDLNIESALYRRHARISDVSVNNVIWVDNSVKGKMKDGIEDLLMMAAKPVKQSTSSVEQISVDDFFRDVLPKAQTIELMVKNHQTANFVSLTAPVYADSGKLFKWNNDFAWSYDGNVTDSIKERVKRAGGNVSAPFRVSLAWHNLDDLDIHAYVGHEHIYFGNRAGVLDVDMNVGSPIRGAVENLSWKNPRDGVYEIKVNQYFRRETELTGFEIEVENNGKIEQYTYDKPFSRQRDTISFGKITIKNGEIAKLDLNHEFKKGSATQEKWGVNTEQFTKVNTVMLSPNYWDDNSVGNKHWFFVLDGCKNPEPCRGIYNEFLSGGMEEHRKVFEVLGNKTKCEVADEQLSGVGFSSTRNDSVIVRVTGQRLNKIYEILF